MLRVLFVEPFKNSGDPCFCILYNLPSVLILLLPPAIFSKKFFVAVITQLDGGAVGKFQFHSTQKRRAACDPTALRFMLPAYDDMNDYRMSSSFNMASSAARCCVVRSVNGCLLDVSTIMPLVPNLMDTARARLPFTGDFSTVKAWFFFSTC